MAIVHLGLFFGSTEGARVEMEHLNEKNFTMYCDMRYYRVPYCKDSASGYFNS